MNRIKEVLEQKGIKQTWLAEKLGKSYNMINSYVQNRRQPSLQDLFSIAKILDVSVSELIWKEEKKTSPSQEVSNYIVQEDNEQYATSESTIDIPLIGMVACGTPIFAEENVEAYIPVSKKLIKSSNKYFILRASGDSMNEKDINDGDLLLIRQQPTANNGDLVVALIDDEATVKEFQYRGSMIVLLPRSTNKSHQPIILTSSFKIQGIVVEIIQL